MENVQILIQFVSYPIGKELTEAKEKLAKAESSSSDSEDDAAPKRRRVETADRPTEEMIEKQEEKLEAANVDQKRLFLIVFQRFIMILSEHLVRCDTDGRDYDTDWYRWTIGRLQQVFLMVSVELSGNGGQIQYALIAIYFLSIPVASRTSAKVQQHIGDTAVLIRFGFAHLRCVPTIYRFDGVEEHPKTS